jgi:hypothetical protein
MYSHQERRVHSSCCLLMAVQQMSLHYEHMALTELHEDCIKSCLIKSLPYINVRIRTLRGGCKVVTDRK